MAKRSSLASARVSPKTSSIYCSVWFWLCVCAVELCLLGALLHLRQPAFHDLSYLRTKIETVQSQSKIRADILHRLELELQTVLNSTSTSTSSRTQLSKERPPDGSVIVFMNDSPAWFQRRYSSMILNILVHTPSSWVVQIFHNNNSQFHKGLALNPGLRRLLGGQGLGAGNRVRLVPIPRHVRRNNKNKHMLFLPWVWEHMPSEIVLLIGGNHVLCSNSPYTLLDFLHTRPSARGGGAAAATVTSTTAVYDYLGAPWHNKQGRGGGGGVSLRNATTMLAILTASLSSAASSASTEEPHLKWGDEDVFFVSYMLHANHQHKLKNKDGYPHFNLATTEVMSQFSSSQDIAPSASFSVSGPLPLIPFERRQHILETSCPDLKLLLPSLHEPACFGNDLTVKDIDKCRQSICSLNNSKKKSC